MAVEMALLTPFVIGLLMLLVAAGRIGTAQGKVEGAARDAARAATLSRGDSETDAKAAARQTLNGDSLCAGGPVTHITPDAPQPDDVVVAVVECKVRLSDLGVPGLRGVKTIKATVRAPVDTYRGP